MKYPSIARSQISGEGENFENRVKNWKNGNKMPYLLELLDSTLVNTTALVDQVCS
jgi:hypothetical protein